MQVVLILGGGIGKRFGTVLPKQYNLIDGKPVIDYVIEAALQARQTDRIVVVCDPQYSNHSRYMNQGQVEIVPGGAERYDSLQNGLNYIKRHYDCQKLCILDAVAPFVYPELIDDYFERLDAADAVITCQKSPAPWGIMPLIRWIGRTTILRSLRRPFAFRCCWRILTRIFPQRNWPGNYRRTAKNI